MAGVLGWLSGRTARWVVLPAALLLSAGVFALAGGAPETGDPGSTLPAGSESAAVRAAVAALPGAQAEPALVVYARGGAPLTADDVAAIDVDRGELARLAVGRRLPPTEFGAGRAVAVVTVVLPNTGDIEQTVETVAGIRETVRAGLPAGATAQVTGPAGFRADVASVFDGADLRLLLATIGVVAVLLIVTYRSPWLWLVPLVVIALGDQVAARLLTVLADRAGLTVDASITGIVSVLVFGAGTNYALLLIARYREELRRAEDRFAAMGRALRGAAPAIAASAATVAASLLTLAVADLPTNRSVGLAGAAGIAVALLFGLVVLPPALLLFGRGLFWPRVPHAGQPDPTRTGPWARVGAAVARRPVLVLTGTVAVLALLALGTTRIDVGLAQNQQFRERVEAVAGAETLARAFPPGAADPTTIITTSAYAEAVRAAAAGLPGVESARVADRAGQAPADVVRIDAVLAAAPGTDASDDTIRALRSALDAADPAALVGGNVAGDLDLRDAAARDERVVAPLVLAVVLVILVLVLRALVAPLLLVGTVVLSYFAALGAASLIFTTWLDFPALDAGVPLLGFLFLVALGVDYNIFLTTRAREETLAGGGPRTGMRVALAVTGGVITSAGVLLAAVFTVLGVLPLIVLTQLGVLVALGVVLDTMLVRSVLVPAIAFVTGRSFWWPGSASRPPAAAPVD